jgi:hypothetical protein
MAGVQFFAPFTKIDETNRLVHGVASVEEYDNAEEIMDYATTKPYVEKWSKRLAKASGGKNLGNVRAMHGEVAAGHLIELELSDDTKSFPVVAKISDDNEWEKCKDGTYTGFSFGGKYVKKWDDPLRKGYRRYTADPRELSLADAPCVPGAIITMVKTDGTEVQIVSHGSVQQFWGCGTSGHEHFRKTDAEECFEESLEKTGKVLNAKNAADAKKAKDAVAAALEAIEAILESAGLTDAEVEAIMDSADADEDKVLKVIRKKLGDGDDPKTTLEGDGDDPLKKIDATSRKDDTMDQKEKDELKKTIVDESTDSFKKIVSSDDFKKTIGSIVSDAVKEELAKTDDRTKALEENVELIGATLAKFMDLPEDDEPPMKKVVNKDDDADDPDKLAKKDDSLGGRIKQSLRNPQNQLRR